MGYRKLGLLSGWTAGASEVSRFSCMKFLGVPGVFDYAGPSKDSRTNVHTQLWAQTQHRTRTDQSEKMEHVRKPNSGMAVGHDLSILQSWVSLRLPNSSSFRVPVFLDSAASSSFISAASMPSTVTGIAPPSFPEKDKCCGALP